MLDAPWKLKMSVAGYLTLVGGLLIEFEDLHRNLMALTGVVVLHPTLIFATFASRSRSWLVRSPSLRGESYFRWVPSTRCRLGSGARVRHRDRREDPPLYAWLSLLTLLPMGIWSVLYIGISTLTGHPSGWVRGPRRS